MKTYTVSPERAAYHKILDVLYVGFSDGGLESCSRIEDTPSGITVMYSKDGMPTGVEVPKFSSISSGFPARVFVDSASPFEVNVVSARKFPETDQR